MVSAESMKRYLYIPNEITSDDALLEQFIEVAKAYLRNATDNFDTLYVGNSDFEKQCDLFITLYVSELYNNRNLYCTDGKPSYMCRALMYQIQTYEEGE